MSDHVYLSTACLHDRHEYCSASEGIQGIKVPAKCKWCPARCVCPCHGGCDADPSRSASGHTVAESTTGRADASAADRSR